MPRECWGLSRRWVGSCTPRGNALRAGRLGHSCALSSALTLFCCSYGLCGIHYIDAGYLGYKAYFVAPRKGTVWVRGRHGSVLWSNPTGRWGMAPSLLGAASQLLCSHRASQARTG